MNDDNDFREWSASMDAAAPGLAGRRARDATIIASAKALQVMDALAKAVEAGGACTLQVPVRPVPPDMRRVIAGRLRVMAAAHALTLHRLAPAPEAIDAAFIRQGFADMPGPD